MSVHPNAPCIVGVATRTWHRAETGDAGAPEPLDMWEHVVRAAIADAGARGGPDLLDVLESLRIVYCQTWQYDDPTQRLCERLRTAPKHRIYSGIGGTVPQQLVNAAAEQILRGEISTAVVVGAEALDTQARARKRGAKWRGSFPPAERRPFPYEAPFHDAEVAHEIFPAWLTFAIFDNARRAHLGVGLDEYRRGIGEMMAPMTKVAAANPDAWFPVERTPQEIVTPTAENRMVGYPYTKYSISVMDVDMAAALVLTSHEAADALGVPRERRVYLRGWCYATDPVYLAEHAEMWRSPAMAAASAEALRVAGAGIDDVAHLDLYSCFASSLHFACDALGISPTDPRGLTVTGGLPYHGGAGSDYMTHAIATMARTLRDDPGSLGLCSGVGMHMTKHVYACYSATPGPVEPPHEAEVQARLDHAPRPRIVAEHDGPATVVAYSVVHGRDGAPEWGVLVADLADATSRADTPGAARAYARFDDPEMLAAAEQTELVGVTVRLVPTVVDLPTGGQGVRHTARLTTGAT